MENQSKRDDQEIRYDASGNKITAPARSKELESAILAINDKLDQLLGILSSTLPTRIGAELKGVSAGGENLDRLIEVVTNELPERIKKDSSENTFEKAEMLSMVISTSFQHLNDAFRSYQESIIKALDGMSRSHERTGDVLVKINTLLEELHTVFMERNRPAGNAQKEASGPFTKPETQLSKEPTSPFQLPEATDNAKIEPLPPADSGTEEKSDLPGWLQAKREDENTPSKPEEPES